MPYRALCRKCQILLFDVPNIKGFGKEENEKVTVSCRSCGAVFIVTQAEDSEDLLIKKPGWKKPQKAIHYD